MDKTVDEINTFCQLSLKDQAESARPEPEASLPFRPAPYTFHNKKKKTSVWIIYTVLIKFNWFNYEMELGNRVPLYFMPIFVSYL